MSDSHSTWTQTNSLRYKELNMILSQRQWSIRIGGAAVLVAGAITATAVLRRVPMLVALLGLGVLVVLILKIRANRKTKVIFDFYGAANEILIDGEGSRYHFEIAGVIRSGEKIIKSMPDAPPLSRFALGALYYSIGDHNGAVEQLGFSAEEELLKESQYLSPSPQLRRYVKRLRKVERRPRRYAKLNAAITSLERMRQERAGRLLAESQKHLRRLVEAYDSEKMELDRSPRPADFFISSARSLKSITAPPTISEVLSEVYQEEPKAS
ncbi:MAG TPA: hypothetical protein VGO56_14225 [Pyrinomonadaceae bacterium]|jgi:hypothetical protein|nr:hypothetical protein [Pyrinomonadaceae bacterium]